MPFIAVATVAVLCGNAIAQNASAILSSGLQVVMSVCWLHASGFFFGYVLSRTIGIDISSSRTISIEVGMQVISSFCLQLTSKFTVPSLPN
jgi:BASS family bile acid:Na+ symporter